MFMQTHEYLSYNVFDILTKLGATLLLIDPHIQKLKFTKEEETKENMFSSARVIVSIIFCA